MTSSPFSGHFTGKSFYRTTIRGIKPVIPKQTIEKLKLDKKTKRSSVLSVITGSLGGILVSIIPGITAATGTILAMNARGNQTRNRRL